VARSLARGRLQRLPEGNESFAETLLEKQARPEQVQRVAVRRLARQRLARKIFRGTKVVALDRQPPRSQVRLQGW
jgi:hypothetical protein